MIYQNRFGGLPDREVTNRNIHIQIRRKFHFEN